MSKFAIITDTCSDLGKDLREKYDVEYVPMHFHVGEETYVASLDWEDMPVHDFYNLMRAGTRITTSQVSAADYEVAFEKHLAEGRDVLSISCSSALSASVNASYVVAESLKAKYPERKIICIDSLTACYGLGLLCIHASELRAEGKSIDEVAEWVMENRNRIHQECTVDKLSYLKRAGRVTAASAFFGGLLQIKPIIISDANGNNAAIEKMKGTAAAFQRIAERVKAQYEEVPYQKVYFAHADSVDLIEKLKAEVMKVVPADVEVYTGYIGPIVGASVGPGTVAVYFYGNEITDNKKEQ